MFNRSVLASFTVWALFALGGTSVTAEVRECTRGSNDAAAVLAVRSTQAISIGVPRRVSMTAAFLEGSLNINLGLDRRPIRSCSLRLYVRGHHETETSAATAPRLVRRILTTRRLTRLSADGLPGIADSASGNPAILSFGVRGSCRRLNGRTVALSDATPQGVYAVCGETSQQVAFTEFFRVLRASLH